MRLFNKMARSERRKALLGLGDADTEKVYSAYFLSRSCAETIAKLQGVVDEAHSILKTNPEEAPRLTHILENTDALIRKEEHMILSNPYLEKLPKS